MKAADATVTKSKLDYDDGRQVYEIEFYVSGSSGYTEYDYEIEAATGKIVSYDHDAESYAPPARNTRARSSMAAWSMSLPSMPPPVPLPSGTLNPSTINTPGLGERRNQAA